MRKQNLLRPLIFLLLCAASALPSWALFQEGYPESAWRVLDADWGAGNRRVDVTDRVRQLLSGNGRVKVNNTNMGGDPAPGADKVLRIRARNASGQSREFTFAEGDYIDASQFYVDSGGYDDRRDRDRDRDRDRGRDDDDRYDRNGPGWRVTSADWGAGRRRVDVTDRVRQMLSGGGQVKVNNTNLGGDPAPGSDKVLRIAARDARGRVQQFSFKEGDYIDASQFYNYPPDRYPEPGYPGGGYPGDLQIVRAYYGLNSRTNDVTGILRSMARNGSINIKVNNTNLGGDPAPGGDKVLTVIYRVQGREQTATVKEGDYLQIP